MPLAHCAAGVHVFGLRSTYVQGRPARQQNVVRILCQLVGLTKFS